MDDSIILEIQKWVIFLVIFMIIMLILIKTHGNRVGEKGGLLYVFAGVCWFVVFVSSKIRDLMSDSEDNEESFIDFLPNFIITTIWYIYMASCLVFKLSKKNLTGERGTLKTGIGPSGGGTGVQATQLGISIQAIENSATVLVYMGIGMTLINVFSNLYLYYGCESGLEDNTMVTSLVSAQYNIIVIGLVTIGVFLVDKKG
tara:strand:+ start:44 stop:646 length:603 start_codon:yes stop_codon:yes gene_type:complete